MKRSSCLTALILVGVGLSVTSTSLAFAAPVDDAHANDGTAPKSPSARPARVAQAKKAKAPAVQAVQPTDPPATEGGGAAPAPAPAAGDAAPAPAAPATPAAEATPAPAPPAPEPGPTPAISIGSASGNPAVDAPGGAANPSATPKPRPWAGTQIFATSSMTTATVFKGQTQYNNPTVDASLWLQPRYAFSDAWQLRGLLVFSYEFTNADDTVTKNEPRFSDTSLSLYYRKIPEIPGGIKPAVAISTSLPTSPESRARTNIFTPGLIAQLTKTFEHVGGGTIDLLASGAYSHPIYRDTTAEVRTPAPYAFQCVGGDSCQDQLSGTFNVSDQIRYTLLVSGEWGKWSPALFYRGTSQWAYHGSDVRNPVDGTVVGSPSGFAPTSVRQSSYFSAWLDYNANSWLTAEVGYWLERSSALDGQAHYGNPFWDRYQDQRVFIGASFNIDNIMKQLEGGPTEAGIVRAQNKTGPIGHL